MKIRNLMLLFVAIAVLGFSGCMQVDGDGNNATIRYNTLAPVIGGLVGLGCFAGCILSVMSDATGVRKFALAFVLGIVGVVMFCVGIPDFAFSKVVITPETVTISRANWFNAKKTSFPREGVSISVEETTRMTRRGRRTDTEYIFHTKDRQTIKGGAFGEALAEYLTMYPYPGGGRMGDGSRAFAGAASSPPVTASPPAAPASGASAQRSMSPANLAQNWPSIRDSQLPGYADYRAEEARKKIDEWKSRSPNSGSGLAGSNPNRPGGGSTNPGSRFPGRPGTGFGQNPGAGRGGSSRPGFPRGPGFGSPPNMPNFPRPPGFGGRR